MSIYCSKCGQENTDESNNCMACGNSLKVASPPPVQNTYVQQPINANTEKVTSILGWIGYLILFAIPVVNIISYIIILCTSKSKSLKNFVIAKLIIATITIVLSIIICIILSLTIPTIFSDFNELYYIY